MGGIGWSDHQVRLETLPDSAIQVVFRFSRLVYSSLAAMRGPMREVAAVRFGSEGRATGRRTGSEIDWVDGQGLCERGKPFDGRTRKHESVIAGAYIATVIRNHQDRTV